MTAQLLVPAQHHVRQNRMRAMLSNWKREATGAKSGNQDKMQPGHLTRTLPTTPTCGCGLAAGASQKTGCRWGLCACPLKRTACCRWRPLAAGGAASALTPATATSPGPQLQGLCRLQLLQVSLGPSSTHVPLAPAKAAAEPLYALGVCGKSNSNSVFVPPNGRMDSPRNEHGKRSANAR